jgi:hypothetical protein
MGAMIKASVGGVTSSNCAALVPRISHACPIGRPVNYSARSSGMQLNALKLVHLATGRSSDKTLRRAKAETTAVTGRGVCAVSKVRVTHRASHRCVAFSQHP